ncbi:hypothetical protein BDZ97DRAFT_1924573 [Flammula alnicola]|nr:hypothetical protein BDZ97DRAFT_1924573 [Flammula alnicola]
MNEFQPTQTTGHHPFSLHGALTSDAAEGQEGRVLDKTQAIVQQGDTVPAAVDGPLAPHSSNPRSIALCQSASRSLPYDGTKKHSLDDKPCLHPSDYDAIADRTPHGEIDSDAAEGWVVRTLDKARTTIQEGELASQRNAAAQEVAQTTADGPLTVCSLDDSPLANCSLDSRLPPSNTTADSMQVNALCIQTSDFDSTVERLLYSDIDSDATEEHIMGIAQHGNSALQPSTIAQENARPTEGPTLAQAERVRYNTQSKRKELVARRGACGARKRDAGETALQPETQIADLAAQEIQTRGVVNATERKSLPGSPHFVGKLDVVVTPWRVLQMMRAIDSESHKRSHATNTAAALAGFIAP